MSKPLIISSSPHLKSKDSIKKIMWSVVIALIPAAIWGIYKFGWYSGVVLAVCIITALITEVAVQFFRKKPITITDGSAIITGLLVGFNLPPAIPLWLAAVGSFVAIAIAKHAFGGLGHNIFNPALVGRAFLLAAAPKAMTTWAPYSEISTVSGATSAVDAVSGATMLGIAKMNGFAAVTADYANKFDMYKEMFLGNKLGCIGEISVLLLLLGAAFLFIRKIITWHIPISYLASAMLLAWILGIDPIFTILSGGIILGAFFMATDMVTSPITRRGQIIFGCGCGILNVIIRKFGGYPEGCSYAILIMNIMVPLIDVYFPNKVFGKK